MPAVDLAKLEDVFVVIGEMTSRKSERSKSEESDDFPIDFVRNSSFVIRSMIFFLILVVLVFVAQIVEIFIPPLDWMFNAHVYIVPVIVFYGAMALPFPLMLCARFCRRLSMGRDDRAGARRAC